MYLTIGIIVDLFGNSLTFRRWISKAHMAIDTRFDVVEKEDKRNNKKEEENSKTYGVVDLEEELICALRKIKKLKKKILK